MGQEAARSSLEHALELGVRRLLLIGPEGSGKSTWLRSLEEQGRGVRVSPDSLEHAPFEALLLVEDVDRLSPDAQAALAAFLARNGQRSVLLTARGSPASPGPVLLSDSGRLPLLTTAALSEAVQGSLPVALLEQVQHLVSLEPPSAELLVEIARRQLALREQCRLSDEALHALASEAARSPRSGHELQALLARVPPGSWRLEAPSKPARRVRRKGTS
ncbi:MAG TPA: AAA family ATPase [Myxococcaceae bacterium]|nr:AAA family ATPase [Myxococcaceae bacterium]